jgi:uncharacterized protein YeaO (DUF488 family)
MLKRKSVGSPKAKDDGLRILAARYRGRFMPASRYDVWMPSLAPSERLLKAALAGRISWAQLEREYRHELFSDAAVDKKNAAVKNHGQKFTLRLLKELGRRGHVTFMCHCPEDAEHCHTRTLLKLLKSAAV